MVPFNMAVSDPDVFALHRYRMNEIAQNLGDNKKSIVLNDEKHGKIVRLLKGENLKGEFKLKHTVKEKKYVLANFPPLNLKDVLCIPCDASEPCNSIFGKFKRVAKAGELYEIVHFVHGQLEMHRGYKKTLSEVSITYKVG